MAAVSNSRRQLLVAGLLALAGAGASARAQEPPPATCAPSAELHFLCGAERPEDLAQLPGDRWLVASGFSPGAGLKLVDTRTRTLRRWYSGAAAQLAPDTIAFPACPGPPDAERLTPRGLSLRDRGAGRLRLHVVNHGGREAIELFDVDPGADEPALRWVGCLPMPEGHVANSVASFSDGTVLVTVLTRPGTTITDFVRGQLTGIVLEWRPGDTRFRPLPGTELPGNNGIETSRDDRFFYVVAFGWHAILVFDRADTTRPPRVIPAPGFMPDNIHWSGGRLLAAGMRTDEPACGGLRRIVGGVADAMLCPRGAVVAELDPLRGAWTILLDLPPDPRFNGVSAASIVGGTLWLGSYQADRLAWRVLPDDAEPRGSDR